MTLRGIAKIAALGASVLIGCTGGDMGNTRGGGAAPGQSGGRDTTRSPSAAGAASSGAVTPARPTDTTKQRAKAKQP